MAELPVVLADPSCGASPVSRCRSGWRSSPVTRSTPTTSGPACWRSSTSWVESCCFTEKLSIDNADIDVDMTGSPALRRRHLVRELGRFTTTDGTGFASTPRSPRFALTPAIGSL
jgi:hypothetical protein